MYRKKLSAKEIKKTKLNQIDILSIKKMQISNLTTSLLFSLNKLT
jgi:hypothetical protein